MQKLAIIMFILLLLATARAMGTEISEVVAQLQRHSAPTAVPAKDLAPVIVSLSHFYHVPAQVIASVVLQESGARANAVNIVTHDYGIGQINRRTAAQYGINKICLMDYRCNLAVTVKLLAATHGEVCRFNVGQYRVIEGYWVQRCAEYNAHLAQND